VAHNTHVENPADPGGSASDTSTPIAVGAGFQWDPRTHDTLAITNPGLKNGQGHVSEYHLMEAVESGGITEHYEPFTHNELWVTAYDPNQFAAKYLPTYTGTNVANADVVLWVKSTIHHHPRDEDGLTGGGSVNGTAEVMWSGFVLMPHDLFSCSPFYSTCP